MVRDYWGAICLDRKQYAAALPLFQESAAIYRQIAYDALLANAYRNLGRTHLLCARPDSTFSYYLQALKLASSHDAVLFMDIFTEFFEVCRQADDWEEACVQMLRYRRDQSTDERLKQRYASGLFAATYHSEPNEVHGLEALQSSLEGATDLRRFASEYLPFHTDLCRLNEHVWRIDHELEHKYNNEVLKNENQQMQNELLRRGIWILTLIISLICLVDLSVGVYYGYRRRVRRRIGRLQAQLLENERRLNAGETASMEERERLLKENASLAEEIGRLIERQHAKDDWNACLQKQNLAYSKRLKALEGSAGEFDTACSKALMQLFRLHEAPSPAVVHDDEEWRAVFSVIDTLYGDLSSRLHEKELGMQDCRICYLLHAGFSNRDVALATGVSMHAVLKAKQRMKAKLALPPTEKLKDFLFSSH